MKIRTITLSDRPPVKIDEDLWPILAQAKDAVDRRNGTPLPRDECAKWSLIVRQHADGRAIVYGVASAPGEGWPSHGASDWKGGELIPREVPVQAIVEAIKRVGGDMMALGGAPTSIVRECIADMPPEELK